MGSQARLRIIQVTDCYTLVNFPSLKTLIQQKRAEAAEMGGKTIRLANQYGFCAPKICPKIGPKIGPKTSLRCHSKNIHK